jgi:histidine kinase
MQGFPGFEVRRVAWSANGFTAYDAISVETGERVLLKRWETGEVFESLEQDPIWREQYALREIGASKYSYAIHLHRDVSGSWAVMPWFAGTPLSDHMVGAARPPLLALSVIKSVAILLDYLHAARGIHGSLSPESILWCEATETARLSDLGCVLLPGLPMLGRSRLREYGKALYLSPEGTGRIGADMDYRSDFYSLGAILYQLLLGKPPFEYRDPLQLAHAHLARQPVALSSIDDAIPRGVSDVVLKLLEKTPDARYRSGAGLAADLERCRQEFAATGRCESFSLGQEDVPTQLRLSTTLYGQSAAQKQVLDTYECLKGAGRGLVMVSGYPGVGKTSLVESIRRDFLKDEGYFAIGKFRQSTSAQPYVGLVMAAAHLASQLLSLPENHLSMWRTMFEENLGRNVGVLCKLVSEMELVVGEDIPSVEISIDDAKAQFLLTVKRFFRLFTRKGSPFVLFLDDVQWMDEASKEVLDDLLSDPDLEHFLAIVAYRTNEVATGSALKSMLESPADVSTIDIFLEPLGSRAIVGFLMDSFACSKSYATSLARLLKTKTDGNPFFLRRYVASLVDSGLIHYSADKRRWRWDLDRIREQHVSENLVDFMLERLKTYSCETQESLNHMACLGGVVSTSDLSLVSGVTTADCSKLLMQPVNDGLVLRVNTLVTDSRDAYRFAHDKVEQAAYALLESARRQDRHAQIAKRMYRCRRAVNRNVFGLVEQLDKAINGHTLILEIFRPLDLATIYLCAGERAKDNTAYSAARYYLERAAAFIDEAGWEEHYDLNRTLHRARAEVEYQLGELDAARSFLNVALRHCREPSEQADLYTLLIVQDTLQGHYQEALDRGRYALSLLDFELPRTDIARILDEEVERLISIDIEVEYPDLLALEEIGDSVVGEILDILMYLIPPSYFVHPDLNDLIAAIMTRLSIEHGVSPAGTKGLSNFGPVIAKRGQFRKGYLFARLALELADKHGYWKARPRVLYTLAGDLNHWVNHLRTTRDIIDDGFTQCVEQGERDYGGYLLTLARCQNEIFLGRPIGQFKKEVTLILDHVSSTQNTLGQGLAAAAYMALSHLDGTTDDDSPFDIEELRESTLLQSIANHDHGLVGCYFHLLKAHNYCFLGRYREAGASIATAIRYRNSLSTEMTLPMLNLFSSICAFESLASEDLSQNEREELLAEVQENLDIMNVWSDGCPENFQHCFLIIRAGLEVLEGRTLDALGSYEEAVCAAHDNDYIQFEGLIQSMLADLWRRQGKSDYADVHLARARACYVQWGARRLVSHIDALSNRAGVATSFVSGDRKRNGAVELDNEELDLRALLKLTQRLSGEIDIEGLKVELVNAIVEVTGAQKAVVFLAEDGRYEPVATLDIEGWELKAEEATYPASLVNLVGRTKEASVVQDGVPDANVAHDPYLLASRPVSALCLPLVQQTALEGMVYIENRINRMDLSERKLRYLSILGSQAAISIRNSLLYSDLEKKVEDRTKSLANLAGDLEARVERQVDEIKKLEKLRRFLSPHVADLVLNSGDDDLLKSHRRRIAILFCDLRGYTPFSESVEPEEAIEILQAYHRTLGVIIHRHGATVDHLAGDGVMVFLGDPIVSEQPITEAIDMAVEMRSAIDALLAEWDPLTATLGFGIGVTYGYATIGLIGHEARLEYSANGRYANLASRLCDQAKKGQILVTKRVVVGIKHSRTTEFVGEMQIKGFTSPVSVFDVIR